MVDGYEYLKTLIVCVCILTIDIEGILYMSNSMFLNGC